MVIPEIRVTCKVPIYKGAVQFGGPNYREHIVSPAVSLNPFCSLG